MLPMRAVWLLLNLVLFGIVANGAAALVVPFSTRGRSFSSTRQTSRSTSSRLHLASDTDDYGSPNEEEDEYGEPSFSASSSSSRPRRRPIRLNSEAAVAQQKEQEQRVVQAKVRHQEALKDPTLLSDVRFAERTDIHPATKRAIKEVLGHEQMTEIQSKTFAAALSGQSVLGRARTGTGKTLAFLLPVLEQLMAADATVFRPGKNVGVLIVAPTRELAIQIAEEASALLTFHTGEWSDSVLCLYGGTKIQRDIALLNKQIPSILVCPPGRLQDHLDGTRVRSIKFSDIIAETRLVVLDETDRLLDGFQKETKKILSYLPRSEKRQTLLFSATVPKKLKRVLDEIMPPDYIEVDCIDRDVTSETNIRVDQSYAVLPSMDLYVPGLVSIVKATIKADPNAKIVVFLPAAKLVKFFADLFNVGLDIPVTEMHSRITQSARNRASSAFRNAKGGVLLTSDVSARGKWPSPFTREKKQSINQFPIHSHLLLNFRRGLPRRDSCCSGKAS
jgi:ATP-dependent RNA helicase MSS116